VKIGGIYLRQANAEERYGPFDHINYAVGQWKSTGNDRCQRVMPRVVGLVNAFRRLVNQNRADCTLLCYFNDMNTERLWYLLDRLKVHHILFWICYYFFWVQVYRSMYTNIMELYIVTGIYLVFNSANFYLVSYWVVPQFYKTRRYVISLLLFVGILLAASVGLSVSLNAFMWFREVNKAIPVSAMFYYGVISNLTIFGVASGLKQMMGHFRADRTEAEARGTRIEAELQYLKAQVNPHFLFNAINSVYFLIKKDPDKASETLIKLSDLLRFQLYDCSANTIGIDQELVYLENYMALEKLRRGERVTVEYHREGELRGFQLAPLILIPFLENAFKFVSSHTDRPNIIRVVLSREDTTLRASFFNMYEKLQRNDVGGIGLKNVTRRLELLYPKYTLDVKDERDTYSVTLTIPLS